MTNERGKKNKKNFEQQENEQKLILEEADFKKIWKMRYKGKEHLKSYLLCTIETRTKDKFIKITKKILEK